MTLDELKSWLKEAGIGIVATTCDAQLRPDLCRVCGIDILSSDRARVYISEIHGRRMLSHLAIKNYIAISASRPFDYSAIQFKGRLLKSFPMTNEETEKSKEWAERYRHEVQRIGVLRQAAAGLNLHADLCLEISIDEFFIQTPGAKAGVKVEHL